MPNYCQGRPELKLQNLKATKERKISFEQARPYLDEVVRVFVVAGVRDKHADVVQHGGGFHEEAVVVVQRQGQLRAAVLAAGAARLHAPQNLLHEREKITP